MHSRISSCCQLDSKCNRLTRPLCSNGITRSHRSYRTVRPSVPLWPFRLVACTTCTFTLTSERLVPAVPHKSPDQTHASFTPVAVCPVVRFPADLSQEFHTPLVLAASFWFTTRHRRFTYVRLSDPYLFEVHPQYFTPTLTTTTLYRSGLKWFEACS
jgi:hypothetical protein